MGAAFCTQSESACYHGTNDRFFGSEVFSAECRMVLRRLQERYKGVPLAYVLPFDQCHATDIRNVAAEFENCHVVETSSWQLTFTDGLHPDVNGARVAGDNLADALLRIFGNGFFAETER